MNILNDRLIELAKPYVIFVGDNHNDVENPMGQLPESDRNTLETIASIVGTGYMATVLEGVHPEDAISSIFLLGFFLGHDYATKYESLWKVK